MAKRFTILNKGLEVPVSVTSVPGYIHETEKRLKNSTFLVTCNTNFRPKTNEQSRAAADLLRNAAEETFKDQSRIIPLVKFLDGKRWGEDTVKDVDVLIGVELGRKAKGGRIHCHIKVEINHWSKIHLDPVVIKSHMNLRMTDTLSVRYINITVKNGVRTIEDYIRK